MKCVDKVPYLRHFQDKFKVLSKYVAKKALNERQMSMLCTNNIHKSKLTLGDGVFFCISIPPANDVYRWGYIGINMFVRPYVCAKFLFKSFLSISIGSFSFTHWLLMTCKLESDMTLTQGHLSRSLAEWVQNSCPVHTF